MINFAYGFSTGQRFVHSRAVGDRASVVSMHGRGMRTRTWQLALSGTPLTASESAPRSGGRPRRGEPARARIAQGVYLVDDSPLTLGRQCRALLPALPKDSAYSHWTAASLLGLPSRNTAKLHVILAPRSVLPQRAELVVHGRELVTGDIIEIDGLPMTSGPRLFIDLAAMLTERELVVLGDALLRTGHAVPPTLSWRVHLAARRRGVVRARDALKHLDGRAQSVPESVVRHVIISGGLPAPVPQLPILDQYGRVVAHADLGYEDWKILIEYEGRQHSEADQFGRDIERYSRMAADGWLVIRFSAAHLTRPHVILDRVQQALLSRGWTPPPRI